MEEGVIVDRTMAFVITSVSIVIVVIVRINCRLRQSAGYWIVFKFRHRPPHIEEGTPQRLEAYPLWTAA